MVSRFRQGGQRRRGRPRFYSRRKVCSFCADHIRVKDIDYKDLGRIRRYVSERARMEPRRKTGTCAKCQRALSTAIKRARHLALLPFSQGHLRVGRDGAS